MWAVIFGVAAAGALNPIALGLVLLLLSRSRPVPSLFAYWAGAMVTNLPVMVVPLLLIEWVPAFSDLAEKMNPAHSSVTRYVQLSLGVLAIVVAGVIVMRASRPGGGDRDAEPDHPGPAARTESSSESDRLTRHIPLIANLAAKENSKIRRLVKRVYAIWESDALWIAFVLGMITFIGPEVVFFVDTAIVMSGAPLAVQLTGTIVFVVVAFSVFEIALIAHLVAPERSRAVVGPIHDWTRRYRRRLLVGILLLAGVGQIALAAGVA